MEESGDAQRNEGTESNSYTFERRSGVIVRSGSSRRENPGCAPFVDAFDVFPTLRAEALREFLGPYF